MFIIWAPADRSQLFFYCYIYKFSLNHIAKLFSKLTNLQNSLSRLHFFKNNYRFTGKLRGRYTCTASSVINIPTTGTFITIDEPTYIDTS